MFAELNPLVDAGLRHIVVLDVGAVATGGSPGGFVKVFQLKRCLLL